MRRDWANLHDSVLDHVVHHLEDDPASLLRFTAVCRNWSSAAQIHRRTCDHRPKPTQIPWFILSSSSPIRSLKFYSLAHQKVHDITPPQFAASNHGVRFLGSSDGFLIYTDIDVNIHAVNPLTGAHLLFPSPSTLPGIADASKILLVTAVITVTRAGNPTVALVYNGKCGLAFAKHGEASWTALVTKRLAIYDIIFYKCYLFSVTEEGELLRFDLDRPLEPPISVCGPLQIDARPPRMLFLAESPGGDELFAFKYTSALNERRRVITGFLVFRLDESRGKWEAVKCLGDLALFFTGMTSLFAVCTEQSPLLKRNSVYFVDSCCKNIKVFSLADGSIEECVDKNLNLSRDFKKHVWQHVCLVPSLALF